MSKEYIIGIDLGTTNSVVAKMGPDGRPVVLENRDGARTTPSVVTIDDIKKITTVGRAAKSQAITNPAHTIFAIKRFIGQKMSAVKQYVSGMPYKIVEHNNKVAVDIDGSFFSPEEISAKILQKLVSDAEVKIGCKITKAVITVPAYFDDAQRQATMDAAAIAGLEVKRLVNEPTAAALAYGLDKKQAGKVIVYDLGGGTFDVSVLEISDGVIEVKATSGDTLLGGEDFDNVLIEFVAKDFREKTGVDLLKDPLAKQRLKEECEKAKISLSDSSAVDINIPFITANANGPLHLNMHITRGQFEAMVDALIERTKISCDKALKAAGISINEIDDVILVGGMTRMPKVVEFVEKTFGRKPHQGVNPDEVVALGAAVQAGILQGDVTDVLLLDVTPLSLGIETEGGIFTKMILGNTAIPTKKTQIYSTAADNQSSVTIRVFQGEREMAADNKMLGTFDLSGIEPAPRGMPQIEVSFDIDANGIVKVSAKDQKTGKAHEITIQHNGGLSKEEIEQAKRDAEIHAEEDKKRKQLAEKINQTETIIFGTDKALNEHGDKISEEEKNKIMEVLAALRTAVSERNEADIEKYSAELNSAAANLLKIAYDSKNAENKSTEPEVKDVDATDVDSKNNE